MSFLPVYLDSSALLTLVLPESERAALELVLAPWPDRITSELSAVECRRAVRRQPEAAVLSPQMDMILLSITLLRFDPALLHLAGTIGPPRLRSLDAIHLASALSIGDHPEAFVTYDERLAEAAREAGLNVLMPGS